MGIVSSTPAKVALAKWQFLGVRGAAAIAIGATGTMVWMSTSAGAKPALPTVTADEARLLAKAQEAQQKRQTEARKLKQAEVGTGYQVDPEGNLTGPTDNSDLPTDKSLDEIGDRGASVHAEIAKGIQVGKGGGASEDGFGLAGLGRGDDGSQAEKDLSAALASSSTCLRASNGSKAATEVS